MKRLALALLLGVLGCQEPRAASSWPPPPPVAPPFISRRPTPPQDMVRVPLAAGLSPDGPACDDAVARLRRLAEDHKPFADLSYNVGVVQLRCERAGAAEASFRETLKLDHRHGGAQVQLALLRYRADGDLDETIGRIRKAIRDAKFRLPEGLIHLALLQMKRDGDEGNGPDGKDELAAKRNIQRALALAMGWPEPHAALAQYYWWLAHEHAGEGGPAPGPLELARRVASNALKRFPHSRPLHHVHGLILWSLGRPEKAKAALALAETAQPAGTPLHLVTGKPAIEGPDDPQARIDSAHCTSQPKGETRETCIVDAGFAASTAAPDDAELAAEAAERGVDLFRNFGADHCKDQAAGQATTECTRYASVLSKAARHFHRAGLVGKAIVVRRMLQRDDYHLHDSPEALTALREIAESYEQLGVFDQAATFYERFAEKSPEDDEASAALAKAIDLRYLLGDDATADADLKRFRERYPNASYDEPVVAYQPSPQGNGPQPLEGTRLMPALLRDLDGTETR